MKKPIAAQQARSRESLGRLLRATAETLQKEGLEGATIPRIAARAGLSPGAVYRRFADKDTLLETVYLMIIQQSEEQTSGFLAKQLAEKATLQEAVEAIIEQTVKSYRQHSRLLSSMVQFFRAHRDVAFRRKVDAIEVRTFRQVVEYLLEFRKEMRHPDPERAVGFAFAVAGNSIRDILLMELMTDVWLPVLPKDDEQLVREMTAMMLGYLRAG